MGAATWFGSFGSALGVSITAAASERSTTTTSRGWPFSSKNTVRLPSACGSPTVRNLMISVLPGSISTRFSRPAPGRRRRPASAARRCRSTSARARRSPGRPADRAGRLRTSRSVGGRSRAARSAFSRGRVEVGRRQARAGPVGAAACGPSGRARCSSAGKPPGGWPSRPSKNSTTVSGNASSRSGSSTSSGVRLLATMNSAMSPTTFEVGVTLTMSPNSWLTSAYIRQTSGQRVARPERLRLLDTGSCTARRASRGGRPRPTAARRPVSNGA